MADIKRHQRGSDDGPAGGQGARQRLVESVNATAWWGHERVGARYQRLRLGGVRVVCVVAIVMAVLVACSHTAAPSVIRPSTSSVAPSTAGSAAPVAGAATPLRACAGLVGKPFSAALIGMKVTCSFGGRDTESLRVSVMTESCPDTSPFYVFRSTALDAVDRNVYYGSESGRLLAAKAGTVTAAEQRRQACTA